MAFVLKRTSPTLFAAIAALSVSTIASTRASAEAMLLIEAESGRVLHAENATYPWYPASITKLMTAYVTLHAVKSGRLTLDSLLTVSERAAAQAPSKMGFKPGTTVTIDNALKMLMVKSANDVAVVLAEGVAGSVERFSDEMNRHAQRLGMTQSSFVNPNGLPADGQISSARDLAILARATYREFPEYESYWQVPAIKFGKKTMRNHNSLIGRYPGADGMKTGFICASGFNLVASATRRGRRLIAVVLGSPSSAVRGAKTAALLERGFNTNALSWLTPSLGTVDLLAPIETAPPDMREEMCGKHRKRPPAEDADDDEPTTTASNQADPNSPQAFMLSSLAPGTAKPSTLLGPIQPVNPIVVFTGPSKRAPAADSQIAAKPDAAKPGKNSKEAKSKKAAATAQTAAAPAQGSSPSAPATQQAATRPGQVAAVPAGQFGPPPGQFTPTSRTLPAVGDGPNRWMSFAAPSGSANAAPLTVAPAAQTAVMPMPRPRPKATAPKP